MTALGKLFRTTVFKISLAYLVISAIGAGLVLGSVGDNVKMLIDQQTAQTIDADIGGLSEQYSQGGIRRLVQSVETPRAAAGRRSLSRHHRGGRADRRQYREPAAGRARATGRLSRPTYRAGAAAPASSAARWRASSPCRAVSTCSSAMISKKRDSLRQILGQALLTSLFWLVVIGTLGGLWVARRVLQSRRDHQRHGADASSPAISRAGCRSPEPATNSTGWCRTSTPCWIASAN